MPKYKTILYSREKGKLVLINSPMGMDKLNFTLKRFKYHGVGIEISMELVFVKDGKKYLQECYEVYGGIEAKVSIAVFEWNPNQYVWDDFYNGELDFSVYEITETGLKLRAHQTGFTQKFLNGEDINVDIFSNKNSLSGTTITPVQEVNLMLHSKAIIKQYEAKQKEFQLPIRIEDSFNIKNGRGSEKHSLELFMSMGFDGIKLNELKEVFTLPSMWGLSLSSPNYKANEETGLANITFTYDLKPKVRVLGTQGINPKLKGCKRQVNFGTFEKAIFELKLEQRDNEGNIKYYTTLERWQTPNGCDNNILEGDRRIGNYVGSFSIEPGDEITTYMWMHVYGEYDRDVINSTKLSIRVETEIFDTSLSIKAVTKFEETPAKGVLAYELLNKICEYITDTPKALYSNHFGRTDSKPISYEEDGEGSLRFHTGGFQIRGFSTSEKPFFTNFKDYFKAADGLDNLGVGIENIEGREYIRVEKKQYFYQNEVIADIGNVRDISKTAATDQYFNQIDFGNVKWKNTEINNLDEFNSKRSYTLPITSVKSKEDISYNDFNTSGYSIEFARRQQKSLSPTKDTPYDEMNFTISVQRNGINYSTERNENFKFINGVIDPNSIYNGRFSPGRNLRNWGNILAVSSYKQQGKTLKFSYGEGNYNVSSQMNHEANIVHESLDVPVNSLPDPLFIPEYYNFTAPVSRDLLKIIRKNPYGMIKFSDEDGSEKYGYLVDLTVEKDENKGSFKLLRVFNPTVDANL